VRDDAGLVAVRVLLALPGVCRWGCWLRWAGACLWRLWSCLPRGAWLRHGPAGRCGAGSGGAPASWFPVSSYFCVV